MTDSSHRIVSRLGTVAFALYLCLNLTTPSWRYGPFTWIPLLTIPELSGAPVVLGLFNLLPLIIILSWGITVWNRWREGQPFNLGQRHITLPLLAFTLWGILSLDPALTRRTFLQGLGLGLGWFVYLYLLNNRRNWSRPLLVILIIQSTVALGQFLTQHDLGLTSLGELPLNPVFSGVSVLSARGIRWLRAYGLTTQSNQLGALFAVLLLILIPAWHNQTRPRSEQFLYNLGISLGAAALFVTFSRSAWIACLAGLSIWAVGQRRPWLSAWHTHRQTLLRRIGFSLLIFLPAILLALLYGDLVLSRVTNLDQPLEATSVNDRLTAMELAQKVISLNWVMGVGLGNYADYARQLDANAFTVHNIPLLMLAELGLPGGLLWLWLVTAPFLPLTQKLFTKEYQTQNTQSSALSPQHSALSPQHSALSPQHSALSPQSSVLSPQSSVLNPQSSVLSPQSSVLNPQSSILSPQSSVLSPQPSILSPQHSPPTAAQLAPWIAMIIIGLFDVTLWLTGHWQTAIVFGLLLAHLQKPLYSEEPSDQLVGISSGTA